jgi:hypothetical protein
MRGYLSAYYREAETILDILSCAFQGYPEGSDTLQSKVRLTQLSLGFNANMMDYWYGGKLGDALGEEEWYDVVGTPWLDGKTIGALCRYDLMIIDQCEQVKQIVEIALKDSPRDRMSRIEEVILGLQKVDSIISMRRSFIQSLPTVERRRAQREVEWEAHWKRERRRKVLIAVVSGLTVIVFSGILFGLMFARDRGLEIMIPALSSQPGNASMNPVRVLLSLASFTIAFGFSSYFLREIFPWPKGSRVSNILSFSTAFFVSALFSLWLLTAEAAERLITQITQGFLGVITSTLSVLFIAIGVYLAWKRIKAYIKPS